MALNSLAGGGAGIPAGASGGTAIADNEVLRGNGATGIQGSIVQIDDDGIATGFGDITSGGTITADGLSSSSLVLTTSNSFLGPNSANYFYSYSTELLTLSTSGTTTDTAANLLPANSIIDAVVARVTTTITTATSWALGDPTTSARFAAANSTMTAGATSIGILHWSGAVNTLAAGPSQPAAAKVRITTVGTPGAGVVRIVVFYHTFAAPSS